MTVNAPKKLFQDFVITHIRKLAKAFKGIYGNFMTIGNGGGGQKMDAVDILIGLVITAGVMFALSIVVAIIEARSDDDAS